MLKLLTKIISTLTITLLIVGCGTTNKELKGLNEVDYKIVLERLDFEKNANADMNFEIEEKTNESLTMLLDAHVKIMYKVNLPKNKKTKIKSILYAELKSSKRVQLNKLLIQKKDYYFDSVTNALYVVVDIPYIYMLDNKMQLNLEIAMVTSKRKLFQREVTMLYETKAMRENDEKYMSFKFEESFDSQNVDGYVLSMIQRELKSANTSAFNSEYKKRHSKFFGVSQ